MSGSEALFTAALGLSAPWRVTDIRFAPEAGEIHFDIKRRGQVLFLAKFLWLRYVPRMARPLRIEFPGAIHHVTPTFVTPTFPT
ncbi:hypothetical protein RM530_04635 [Algiphilus sp. W345]|uniref:Uncharacterized protein n=1 Tax=Banduia mediterranea TaxID=3075609 RepID=A0ABU2WGK7_9GAMM|nr:hypothetical protein [Algiphilus sp. W345]MDT0496648.1 hypothetical protein [Algiphilus sp. W345]